ncbi:MAG: DMT family transporter [Ruminococcus sp.]|nr:DMT family transporter [Ruminococcus sp.]
MNMFVKLSGDLPVFEKAFFRNAIAAIIALIVLLKNHAPMKPTVKGSLKFLILRTLFGLGGVLCNFWAVSKMVISDSSILNKMSPFFAVIFAYLFVKERPRFFQWLTLFGALFGAVFVIKPGFANAAFVPALIAFLGGVLAGAAYGCVRKLGLMGENNPFIVFFFSAGSTLIITPIMIATYEPMELWQLGSLLMAGVCAALAQFSITAAYTCAPPKEISVYDFTQVIFTSLISIFVFSAVPDIYSFIGYIIIVSMALVNYLLSNRKTS